MILRTKVRDCLYLNWAVPADTAPPVPEPLRLQRSFDGRTDWCFASALLFHHEGLRFRALPFVRVSSPQLHLRYYVVDGDGRPAVYLRRTFVPLWMAPALRLLGGYPAWPARLLFARPSRDPEAGRWRWQVRGRKGLDAVGERGAPRAGAGPDLGTWDDTVEFFRVRHRAYAGRQGSLQRIETKQPAAATWPLRVDLAEDAVVRRGLGLSLDALPELHSAWLCPEMAMTFELSAQPESEEPVRRSVPAAG